MGNLVFFILCFPFVIIPSVVSFAAGADTLSSGQSIRDGETTLISSDQRFELGFFSPGNSKNRYYIGIWYKSIPDTVLWVANRDDPLTSSDGALTFADEGNLVLLNQWNGIIWSSNLSRTVSNPILKLLDSGNLVLRENSSENPSDGYLWQSFDYPSDTLLPGMKLGWNLLTGLETHLTSWKSSDDPSSGDYVYRIDIQGLPQAEVISTGSTPAVIYRSGPWNGAQFNIASLWPTVVSRPMMVYNEAEVYFWYDSLTNDYIFRITLEQSGLLQRLVAKSGSTTWDVMYSIPNDICDNYGKCGPNSICMISESPICECLKGFEPRSTDQWLVFNWSGGCKSKAEINCSTREGEGFLRVDKVKLPDLLEFSLHENMTLEECRVGCLKNCSCTAYANSKIKGGIGCITWFGDLVNIRDLQEIQYDLDIYIRVPASELGSIQDAAKKKRIIIIGTVSSVSLGLIVLALITWSLIRKRRITRQGLRSRNGDIDLPLLDLATISFATGNFSQINLIGAGGFGPVYKGNLPDGKEIAVKRLLSSSGQGIEEFMAEVVLIKRLQHRNLVGLLGCCIEGEERLLVYEYMPNKSLDHFIFGLSLFLLFGYMSPEYAFDGKFSVKSDVYSFGVLLLEIVSGRKNRGFCHPDHHHNLIGHAWLLWDENRPLELVDRSLFDSSIEYQIRRFIHVGLLCVQKFPEDRPTMSFVVSMLETEGAIPSQPKQPGFFMERSTLNSHSSTAGGEVYTCNAVTITIPVGR
ncbi:hypothetical protein CRG98_013958 [Punica granatum]|uniref:Receptor-like serine/threonine-protein kinase n=1 Tax=Punica granatum TaxID=22663 RepID=A0A2I0KC11_PUNGR|nr:hypothetical protein CRG98_013958 [Punica granatum]